MIHQTDVKSQNSISPLGWQRAAIGLLSLGVLGLFFASLAFGSVSLGWRDVVGGLFGGEDVLARDVTIVRTLRLPRALTAALAGAALACAGLVMQTLFRNPLAGPFVLGIDAGASLGVALWAMGGAELWLASSLGATSALTSRLGAAFFGAGAVLLIVLTLANRIRENTTLLVVGLMLSYASSAIVSVLIHFSSVEQIRWYIEWTAGGFGDVSLERLPMLGLAVTVGAGVTWLLSKPLDALQLGEESAQALGIAVTPTRWFLFSASALLAGAVTTFCGLVVFLDVAAPHLARGILRTSDHRRLLPGAMLVGAGLALAADLATRLPGGPIGLPLNAVVSLIGAPIVLLILLRRPSL